MEARCGVELTTRLENMLEESETWEEPRTEQSRFQPYGAIRDVSRGHTDGDVNVVFTYVDKPDTGLRLHVLGGAPTEVLLGRSFSVRRAGRDSQNVFDFWMPQLVLRRAGEGKTPMRSRFAVVEEPFSGEPFLDHVAGVDVRPGHSGVVALQVSHGDAVDTIVKTDDKPPYPKRVTATGIQLQGRLGIVRQRAGRATRLWLFDGELLQCGDARLDMPAARYEGQILGAVRKADGAEHDAFFTDAELPVGKELQAAWMIVTHGNGPTHGYPIERVERHQERTSIVLSMDHGLRIDGAGTQEVYFPRRNIPGVNRFVIPQSGTLAACP
jgi:hypothetical protein